MSDYQDIAEFLHSLGWQATGDAQWYNLRNALPQLREMLEDSLRQVPEGYVLVRKEAIDWLNGESDFECPPDRYFRGKPPAYWWRSVFREKAGLANPAPPTSGHTEQCDFLAASTGDPACTCKANPATQTSGSSEADELIRALGFDPERFRTEAGFINHSKLRAAIRNPQDYEGLMLHTTPGQWVPIKPEGAPYWGIHTATGETVAGTSSGLCEGDARMICELRNARLIATPAQAGPSPYFEITIKDGNWTGTYYEWRNRYSCAQAGAELPELDDDALYVAAYVGAMAGNDLLDMKKRELLSRAATLLREQHDSLARRGGSDGR